MRFLVLTFFVLFANASNAQSPITTEPWQEVVVSVHDIDEAARFFTEIAGYETLWRGQEQRSHLSFMGLPPEASAMSLVLEAPGTNFGRVRFIQFLNAGDQQPTRPGARAWDSGCFFSIMVRAKNLQAIYAEALKMGWWTETPISNLTFGASNLNIVIFRGPQGMQLQAYERVKPDLPAAFPAFERLSVPFNIMQTVRDRDTAQHFFVKGLGFETFYVGKPYTSATPTPTPLGIPLNLTTSAKYRAGIFTPNMGEVGRVEIIEMMDLRGFDYADQCKAPNYGILSVKFPVNDADAAEAELERRGLKFSKPVMSATIEPYGAVNIFSIKSPDGANFDFFSHEN